MNISQTLKDLTACKGVSGGEQDIALMSLKMLSEYTDDCFIKNENVIANFGKRESGKPHILLDAHLDQIGFIVNYITDDGFLKVSPCGGIDNRLLSAQEVEVAGKKLLRGVICTLPPHLAKDDKLISDDQIYVDIGMSKSGAEQYVSLGDKVSFVSDCRCLNDTVVSGASLDDRSGMTAILRAVQLLKDEKLNCSYSVLFSTQEEVGERGAKTGAFYINPDYAIEVDVSFALSNGENPQKCGQMGEGCMVGISPCLDKAMSQQLINICQDNNITYQIEVMKGLTGTNADQISVSQCGVKSATLSIPLKYMHTPVEIISVEDIESTAQLIAQFIREVKA